MKWRSKWSAFILMFILLLLIGLPWLAARQIRARVSEAGSSLCPTCHLTVQNVAVLPLWRGEVRLQGLAWKSGSPGALEISAAASSVRLLFRLRPLFSRTADIERATIADLEVGLTDGEGKEPKTAAQDSAEEKNESAEEGDSWAVIIRQIHTEGAEFKYVRNKSGTHASLNLHHIDLETETMGLQKQWLDLPAKAKADLRFEKSGAITLAVSAYLQKPLRVDVALFVKDQNLEDLTPFFSENAGVKLSGELVQGRGEVRVRGDEANAKVTARYRDLKVEINKMYDRNELTAFLMDLGASAVMSKKSTNKPAEDQTRQKNLKREPGEPVIGFILRALKETAIAVTRS